MVLIHQNTGPVAVPNLSAMLLAVFVGIPPLTATMVNNGSTIIAGLNGLRPLLTPDEEIDLLAIDLDGDGAIVDAGASATEPETAPVTLSSRALAERSGVSVTTVHRHKSRSNFSEWSGERDPGGIG